MKIIKRILLGILIFTSLILIFRAWIFRNIVTYKTVNQRTDYKVISSYLITYIEQNTDNKNELTINDIIRQGLSITSKRLKFTVSVNDNDPNKLIETKSAHCVGYAAFFSTTCNYLLRKHNLTDIWISKSQKGKLYVFGIDIHKCFNSPFFKSYDFVIIENKKRWSYFRS